MVSVIIEEMLMDTGQKSDYQPSLPERYDLSDEDIYEAMKEIPGFKPFQRKENQQGARG